MRFRAAFALFAATSAIVIGRPNGATAKPEYTRRTSKDCSYCHVPPGYNLNEAGKYYAEHQHSLKGYTPPARPKAVRTNACRTRDQCSWA